MLCASCSFLLDNDEAQCTVDADCALRGLAGATCVNHLCMPPSAAKSDADTAAPSAPVMAANGGNAAPPVSMSAGRGAMMSMSPPPVKTGAGGAPVMSAMAPTAGAPAAGGGGTAGAGGAGMMASGECSVDADCGVTGGRCVGSTCFAPMAQCMADADCKALGPEYDGGKCTMPELQCLPNPRWRCEPPPPPATDEKRMFSVLVRDSLSLNPIANVHIVACHKLDLNCANSVADATTGSDGTLKITLPANFQGYLQQTERSEYAPAMYFLPALLPASGTLEPFPLLTAGVIIDALAATLGGSIDPKRGNLMLIAEDCMGAALAGVTFESPQKDMSTVQFYVRDLLPSPTAKDTGDVGNGGFLNFPTGTALIDLKMSATGLELTTASVVVRAGFISVAYIRPMNRM